MPRPKGYKQSDETKRKISDTHKRLGLRPRPYKRNPNVKIKCLICEKEFEVVYSRKNKAKYCCFRCSGIGKSEKSRENLNKVDRKKLSESNRKRLLGTSGKITPNWQGGKTPEGIKIRNSRKYAEWRKSVFERDNYRCVICGYDKGHILQADHIKPFSHYPELRFVVSNGRTLCKDCHKKTDTYLEKARYFNYAK